MTKTSQLSLQPVEESSNLFIISPTNSQKASIKGTTIAFWNCGNVYNLE